eukprot:5327126-Amphidinium_carterae.1
MTRLQVWSVLRGCILQCTLQPMELFFVPSSIQVFHMRPMSVLKRLRVLRASGKLRQTLEPNSKTCQQDHT